VELAEKNSVVTRLKQQRALLKTWSVVGNRLSELDTDQTVSFMVQKPAEVKGGLVSMLDAALVQSGSTYATESYADAMLVTVLRTDSKAVIAAISEVGLELVARPEGAEAASVELTRVEEQLAAAVAEQGGVHDQAAHTAHTHLHQLRIAGEILQWEQNRFATLAEAKQTESTVVLEGWLRSDKQVEIEEAVKVAGVVALLTEIELTADEVPPVEIANNSFIRPFEAVTRLYGMPGHTDLDPTLFLAGFFFLFFGLSLTDVGYGATLVVISGGLLMFAKLRDGVRSMMKLLFYIGIATMLVGMLFGGYFGIAPELLPAPLQALQQFDPIGNPLPVFYLALGLGVFQVMVGMLLKIYSEHRNGRLVDGIWEQGPWLLLFVVGIVYVLNMFEYATVPTETLVRVAYVGLGLMLVGAIRASDSVLSGLMNIGGSLYGSVGYLSDILSYSRLLALGLATTALAFAVNLIAGIVYDTNPILGPVFAVIILLIGHTFTLAVNTLGAFIHSARLQFVEFFGKFVVGSGRSFAPLARSDNHVTVTKE
jgi:V/A-type H+-transporting ATPase subunit I